MPKNPENKKGRQGFKLDFLRVGVIGGKLIIISYLFYAFWIVFNKSQVKLSLLLARSRSPWCEFLICFSICLKLLDEVMLF